MRAVAARRATIGVAVGVLCLAATIAAADQTAQTLAERRRALAADDVEGRMALARWAEQNGEQPAAMRLYREVLDRDPDHERAYERWVALDWANDLPTDGKRRRGLTRLFGDMKLHATAHFLILYDTDESWTRNRAALLEKAHDVYYRTLRRVGFRPRPLRERLVCILYADHEDYVHYARQNDQAQMGWAAGYYSTRTNRIVFYDDRVSPQFREMTDQLDELEAQTQQVRADLRRAQRANENGRVMALREQLRATMKQRDWYRNRHAAVAKIGNTAKTTHEAVHQLAYNSGLQERGRAYPFWLSEGLATSFETTNPARDFGPLHPNPIRTAGLEKVYHADALMPLDELVAIGSPRTDDIDRLALIYDQSWALFGYVFRYHREELRDYLRRIAAMPPGPRSGDQMRDEFVEAFGAIEALTPDFKRHVGRLLR